VRPYEPKKDKKPTAMVGGAGHWNKRGAKTHKSKGKK